MEDKLKCPKCGNEMEKGKLVISSWTIGGTKWFSKSKEAYILQKLQEHRI